MEQVDDQIRELTVSIWDAILKLPLEPQDEFSTSPQRTIAACVQITGAWQGAVTLGCSVEFAAKAAAIMFALPSPGDASRTDSQDALGELTNMIGGNIKALLPEPCQLSLPAVVEGADYSARVTGAKLVSRVPFRTGDHPLSVSLFEKVEHENRRS